MDIMGIPMDWIALAHDMDLWLAAVNTVMNLRVPEDVGEFLSNYASGFLLRTHLGGVS
jgi:hypothetical protein